MYCDELIGAGFDILEKNGFNGRYSPIEVADGYSTAKIQRKFAKIRKERMAKGKQKKKKNETGGSIFDSAPGASIFGSAPGGEIKEEKEKEEEEKEKDKAETDDDRRNSKAIEENYENFKKLLHFAKHFLHMMGGSAVNNSEEIEKFRKHSKMYYDFEDFDGLRERRNDSLGISCIEWIIDATIESLKKKLPIHDSILILCFEYLVNYNTNDKLLDTFVTTLENVILQCLSESEAEFDVYKGLFCI